MAKIIPVPGVNGPTDSIEFGSDTMQAAWPSGGSVRDEFDTPSFIEQTRATFDSESDSGNKTFGGT